MRTVYATTKPGYADTEYIARQKLLQQAQHPSSASAGIIVHYPDTTPRFSDTRLITLQKQLQAAQS